jgi:tetratricopeptide (TPR) repeat protein
MNKRIFYLAIVMLFLSAGTYGQSAKKYFKAGNVFVKNMKYEEAVNQFTSAIQLQPSESKYYYARGRAYEVLEKYGDAKADYEKTIVFSPKDVNAMIGIGKVCNKMGQFGEALVYLNRASGLEKRNAQIYPEKVITLIGLERFDQALRVSDTAIIIKETPMNYYYRGIIYTKLNNDLYARREFEKAISKDKKLVEPRLALADHLLLHDDNEGALNQINEVLKNDDRNTDAYRLRSRVFKKNFDYPGAINDLSKNILIDPDNPDFYLDRGKCYQEFNQPTNAINDFTKYISLNDKNPDAFFARAKSYEDIFDFPKAMDDYKRITVLSEFNQEARKLLKAAQERLYELNREKDAPEITDMSPVPEGELLEIRGDASTLLITGKIKDKSKIKSLIINDEPVPINEKNAGNEFFANINVTGKNSLTITALDDYDNEKTLKYSLYRTEIIPPKINVMAPYASDDARMYLDDNSPTLYLQGRITDESRIKSILIEGVTASYPLSDLNPVFTATIDILNKNKITIEAEDIYGNRQSSVFSLSREGATIAETNPMGKTWVVFIENSSYSKFTPLEGPGKDVNLMNVAFAKYQIHKFIHKQNMTKSDMEKFFSIELRDLVRTNQVKSLLIWYAGHGKFINEVGYWIPVDAELDNEFSYFNINTLKGSMETYMSYLTHTLVVTDACESGPSFYQAMRSDPKIRSCDDWQATQFKSSQVFSSAGYELAVDDSQFTRTFASALSNNPNACIPIEEVVMKVATAVGDNNKQKPKFGKITGLRDEDGTFFFITK